MFIRPHLPHLAAALSLLFASNAYAAKQIYKPYVEEGEFEVEWKGNDIIDDEDDEDGEQVNKIAVGYGFTDHWFSEIGGEVEKSGAGGDGYDFSAIEWENRFQIFEQGEKWVDVGLYAAYEISLEDDHADKAEVKLLLGKDTGQFSHYANLTLEKEIGAHAEEATEGGIAWSTRYRYKPWLQPGFEYYADFGELKEPGSFDDQKHQVGPVFYGELPDGFGYDIGYLFGLSEHAPDGEIKWVLEYEIHI